MAASTPTIGRVVSESDLYKAPRGRQTKQIPGLTDFLKSLKPGQAAVLDGAFNSVEKDNRSKVSGQIKSHWKMAHGEAKVSVSYNAEGIPQVRFPKS